MIDDIIVLHNDLKGNKLLWNDNWQNKIVDRDLVAIFKAIDETVSELGGIEIYQEIVGVNPYDPTEPVCGLSAQNIFKLMIEGEYAIDPVKVAQAGKIDGNEFSERVDQLSSAKNYVALVNDHRFGHMFLIDIPSNDQETVGYIYTLWISRCIAAARERIPGSIDNYVTGVSECSQQRGNLKDDGYISQIWERGHYRLLK
ncbi:cycle-inhibiting factor [Photorhabdus bodei]|uniref:cycle-inhibiting factor n=1 Tax=Photorhabdus bodei TaxID=2029681 RepID=UPI00232FEFF7|nr:cycle-inhibiting factor [Photorhabdus bodei]MDB6367721.1 cycle-inhibiting factor [Photorhabdus bodei]